MKQSSKAKKPRRKKSGFGKRFGSVLRRLENVDRRVAMLVLVALLIATPLIIIPLVQKLPFAMSIRSSHARKIAQDDLSLVRIQGKVVYESQSDAGCRPRYQGWFQSGSDCSFNSEKVTVVEDSELRKLTGVNKALLARGFNSDVGTASVVDASFHDSDVSQYLNDKTFGLSYFYNGNDSDSIKIEVTASNDSSISAMPSPVMRAAALLDSHQNLVTVRAEAYFHY